MALRRFVRYASRRRAREWCNARAEDPADVAPIGDAPDDDYLIALAQAQQALLVSGDRHLLALAERLPIMSPGAFFDSLPD